jgi:serine/threonine-protein kinase
MTFGRYVLYGPIARGGMATIHVARLVGADGFSRIVAAKRLHPQFAEDPEFVAMLRDEAHIASKVHHPNVVSVLDVVLSGDEAILVQEYVPGVPLHRLFRAACEQKAPIPTGVVSSLLAGVLAGLHAAHVTTDEQGKPLGIVHRDVSPQNVVVTADGVPRLLDFGIAKASLCVGVTRAGIRKGKVAYMAPEQIQVGQVSPASDVYACGVLLWEMLTLRRLHHRRSDREIVTAVLGGPAPTITEALESERSSLPFGRWGELVRVEPVVTRALATRAEDRFASAAEMLDALVRACPPETPMAVAAWVQDHGGEYLERQAQVLAYNEESWRSASVVAAAMASATGPESGVTRVRGSRVGPTDGSVPAPLATRLRWPLPWLIAVASLLLSALLVGTLLGWHASAPPVPAKMTGEPAVAAATSIAPSRSTAAAMAAPAPAANTTATANATATAPPAATAPASAPTASTTTHPVQRPRAAVAPASAAPGAAASAARAVDCDPPFYFEGKKKVFKPGCI